VRGGVAVRGGVGRVAVPRATYIAPARFYRPYYSFRPRFNLGFGLWAGYPLAYSAAFYDPFYYPYGYVSPYSYYPPYPSGAYPYYPPSSYGTYPPAGSNYPQSYPPSGSNYPSSSNYPPYNGQQQAPPNTMSVQPNQSNMGGLSFEITPANAELYVDGELMGTVGQFTPRSQPLGLTSGHHEVEIKASGYRTMSFDVDIVAGQVIPYQGALER
jgi:hypothetical protein